MSHIYPLVFASDLHTAVWGGHRLPIYKGMTDTLADTPIGESWEVSAVKLRPSIVVNGTLKGHDLISIVEQYGAELLGEKVYQQYRGEFPLLIKFIDAQRNLSIQVHPNDAMARRLYDKPGKNEMWYIIDAEPGAHLYAGFKTEIDPEEYRRRVVDGTITDVLAEHEAHPGDVFYIPAGCVHAIGGGILLAEVQQSCDVTYRIYDYNRSGFDGKPRELHTNLAAEALDFRVIKDYRTEHKESLEQDVHTISTPHFDVRVMNIHHHKHRNLIKYDSFIINMCLRGKMCISLRHYDGEQQTITLKAGNCCLIPAILADYDIHPLTPDAHILEILIDNNNCCLQSKTPRFLHITKE